jgi:hypothetical protein
MTPAKMPAPTIPTAKPTRAPVVSPPPPVLLLSLLVPSAELEFVGEATASVVDAALVLVLVDLLAAVLVVVAGVVVEMVDDEDRVVVAVVSARRRRSRGCLGCILNRGLSRPHESSAGVPEAKGASALEAESSRNQQVAARLSLMLTAKSRATSCDALNGADNEDNSVAAVASR